jgi:prepilin-type N-terminal cleavage/methylation domain-containing protein
MINRKYKVPNLKFPRGLSLVEVCIAIAILAILLSSLSGIFNQGYRFLRKTRMTHLACFLAQQEMEKLMHNYTVEILKNGGSLNSSANLNPPFENFMGQVNITYPSSEGNSSIQPYLAQINVTVSWPGQSGVQNFTLISLVNNLSH